jgi:hypothetical protein
MKSNDLPLQQFVEVGMTIEHGIFRGTVIALNFRDRVMDVRVTEVARNAPQNRIGRVIEVPFERRCSGR